MADNHAFLYDAVFEYGRAYKFVHFGDGFFGNLRIIFSMGIFLRRFAIVIFEVGQKNVDITAQFFQCLRFFIAAAVVDDGNVQPFLLGNVKCLNYLRDVMCRRDELEAVGIALLLFEENLRQPFD